jgi:glycerol-3-phosphate acyltransferase PlsY
MHPYLYAALAYLAGAIPVGLVLSRLRGKDPRQVGSGNIGATNVMRTAGKVVGILTLFGDILKGFVPTLLAMYYLQDKALVAFIGFAAFLGHLYPVYLKFRGGKGVATSVGVFLAISPLSVLVVFILFLLVLMKWKYVSLGSLVGSALVPVTLYCLKEPREYVGLSLAIAILTWVKHGGNIRRLLSGTESRISPSR